MAVRDVSSVEEKKRVADALAKKRAGMAGPPKPPRIGSDPAPTPPPMGGAVGSQPGAGYTALQTGLNAGRTINNAVVEAAAPVVPAVSRAVVAAAPHLARMASNDFAERPLASIGAAGSAVKAGASAAFKPPAPTVTPVQPMGATPPATGAGEAMGPPRPGADRIRIAEEQKRLRLALRDKQEGFRTLDPSMRDAARGEMADLRSAHRGITAENTPLAPTQTPEQVQASRAQLASYLSGGSIPFSPAPTRDQLASEAAGQAQRRDATIATGEAANSRVLARRQEQEQLRTGLASQAQRMREAQVKLAEAEAGTATQRATAEGERARLDTRQAQSDNRIADVVLPAQERRAAAEAIKTNTEGWPETVMTVARAIANTTGKDPSGGDVRVLNDAIGRFEGMPEDAKKLAAAEILSTLEKEAPGLSLNKDALEDSSWRWLKWITALSPANFFTDTGAGIDRMTGAADTQMTINDLLGKMRTMRDQR